MRLGGRLQAAIDILDDIETRHRPVADALKDWGLSHRFAGSGDRAAIGNIVYDALRKKLSHGFAMGEDTPRALAFAVLLRQWGYSPERLAAKLEGDKFAPELPLQEQLERAAAHDLSGAPAHVRADIPDWLEAPFSRNFAEDCVAEGEALATRPPLDLRVNTLKAGRDKVLKALSRAGPQASPVTAEGIRIPPGTGPARLPNVTAEPAFQKGWFEVQDEGSQVVAALAGALAGSQVLDLCAGGGGKSLAIAALFGNKGQVHAYDADRTRLSGLVERLRRAGTRNIQLHEAADGLATLQGRMDVVLVDAPCTGTGTWRRRPDTKWRLSPKSLDDRIAEQDRVLREAVGFVRPGGHLVYVTCSLLPEENQDRIEAFRSEHSGFGPADLKKVWSERFGRSPAAPAWIGEHALTLTPRLSGTDGFFVSALRRAG